MEKSSGVRLKHAGAAREERENGAGFAGESAVQFTGEEERFIDDAVTWLRARQDGDSIAAAIRARLGEQQTSPPCAALSGDFDGNAHGTAPPDNTPGSCPAADI